MKPLLNVYGTCEEIRDINPFLFLAMQWFCVNNVFYNFCTGDCSGFMSYCCDLICKNCHFFYIYVT